MNYQTLKNLIITHPQWPGVSDADLVAWCNAAAVDTIRERMGVDEIFAVIASNIGDFSALTADQKQLVRDVLYIHSGTGIPTTPGSPARALLQNVFAGTSTLAALGLAVKKAVSRAQSVGIYEVTQLWDVAEARRLAGV